jgi:steroid delta-isomerase-like uncharacterized protein
MTHFLCLNKAGRERNNIMKKFYRILPLALVLCFVVGCQDKAAMEELEAFRAQAALEEQNREIVKHAWELYSTGDFDAFKELLAPEFLCYSPSDTPKPETREEAIENAKMVYNHYPNVSWTIEELFSAGDKVVTRWTFKATNEGEIMGSPPTGNKVEIGGILITRIENGKIVEEREEYDTLGEMQQLGFELKPKEVKK